MKRLALAAAIVCCWIGLLSAQTNPNLETGIKPYGSYDASKIDSVNLMNLNLTVNIPIINYPQRGSLGRNIAIIYNNKSWGINEHCNLQYPDQCSSKWWPARNGLGVTTQSSTDILVIRTPNQAGNGYIYTLTDYQGSGHTFVNTGKSDPLHSGYMLWRTFDGSAYSLSTNQNSKYDNHLLDSIYVRDKHGNAITTTAAVVPSYAVPTTPTLTEDPNGNIITSTTDSMGRSFSSMPGPNGEALLISTTVVTVNLRTNFQEKDEYNKPITEYPSTPNQFLHTLTIYDGNSWDTSPTWTFEYADNPDGTNYGDLTKITLPTGGSISYAWATSQVCDVIPRPPAWAPVSRVVVSRTVDANDGNGPQTTTYGYGWDYSYSGTAFKRIVTDSLGHKVDHFFDFPAVQGWNACNYFETRTVTYDSDGSVLKTVDTGYANAVTGYADAQGTSIESTLPTTITTALPNGKVSQIKRDYVAVDGTSGTVLLPTNNRVPLGNLMSERVYDYGNGNGLPGAFLKWTFYGYQAFQNTNFWDRNFLDRVSSETVYDESYLQVAQTTYSYDDFGLQGSGVPSTYLDSSVGSIRGNVTKVTKWVGGSVGSLTSTTSYYDSGMPYQSTDFGLHTTTYTYSPTYVGAYVTQTQLPTTHSPNTANHTVNGEYDFNTGLLTTFKDQNGNSSTYSYDALARMTSASFPDGGAATLSYPDFVTVELKKKIDANRWTDEIALFDGVGRSIRKLTANGQQSSPWDQVDTCYYGDGTVKFKSYAYQGAGLGTSRVCSGLGDTFSYDGLQRVKQVLHSDGTSTDTTYTGAAVKTTDEGNGTARVQKIAQSDALGRLRSVCEVTSAIQAGVGATPAACGLDIGGTGFLTSYVYDALGNLKSVSQGGYAPRSFSYDGLSRLTSATNLESGTVTYTYTPDGQVQTRTRPQPNQTLTDSTHQLTTTYTYDELHRLRTTTYSDGVTPSATSNYDETTVAGHPTGYAVGQLTSQTTAKTGEYFWSFDSMGRAQGRSQCTPRSCPLAKYYDFNYTYNLLGADTSVSLPNPSAPASPIVLANGFNDVGRLTSVTSNLSDTNHPASLLSNVQYGPFGITSATIGGLVSQSLSYSQRGWLNGSTNIEPTGTSTPGTVTISGAERSQQQQIPGTNSIGSVTISGALQSKAGTRPGTAGTGSFTISGSSATTQYCPPMGGTCYQIPNAGNVTAIVNGTSYSVGYNSGSTTSSIAANIASAISGGTWANATASGSVVTLTAKTTGAATNYSLSSSCTYNSPYFSSCAFTATRSGSTMTGGTDQVGTTIYDSGTTSVTVNGQAVSTSWSGSATTPASIATALAQAVNSNSTYATARVSGSVVSLASRQTGVAANYTLSASSTYDTVNFTTPSFTATRSGATMTGGTDARTNTLYDAGYVTATANGFTKQAAYGQTDTPSSVASNLAAAFNGDGNSPVTASANAGTLTLTPKQSGSFMYSANSASTNSSFSGPSFTTGVAGGDMKTLYAFSIPESGGFAGNGNILRSIDSVNGNWTYTYDDFNRLLTAMTDNSSVNPGIGCKWQYDRFGNRLQQMSYNGTCFQDTKTFTKNAMSPADTDNRMDGSNLYDAIGNVIKNPNNNIAYAYDAESRIASTGGGYSYIYDASGRRVAKLLNSAIVSEYLLEGSNQVIELDGSGNAVHTNVYAGGKLLATYQAGQTHFHFTDWLGTRRVQANSAGLQTQGCTNYPFGDGQNCTGSDATEHHFTGKERDGETGLDYFGARYYGSNMGRWMSPDWAANATAVPYADFGNPQSLNLYSYVGNNPIGTADADGHCWPPSACAHIAMNAVNKAQAWVQNKAVASGNRTIAATATFTSGVTRDVVNGVIGLGTVGESSGRAWDSGNKTQRVLAAVEDGGKAGGIALLGVGVAGGLRGGTGTATTVESSEAHSATNLLNLNKSLASEAQMGEAGSPFAGAGTPKPIDDIDRLVNQYGGNPADWSKMSSSAYDAADGSQISTHWYQNDVLGTGPLEQKSIYTPVLPH